MFKKTYILFFSPLLTISCASVSNDKKIIIWNSWIPDEFKKESNEFINSLNNKINLLKDKEGLRNLGKIKFEFRSNSNEVIYQNTISNKYETDIAIVPYRVFKNLDFDNLDFKVIAQTATKSFSWAYNDNSLYNDDSFRNITNSYNNLLNSLKPYSEWNKDYGYKDSVYNDFYKQEVSSTYRGQIIISGDQQTLNSIKNAWNNKDLDKFLNFGLIFKNKKSSGSYKLQRALLAKHFEKSLQEIEEKLEPILNELILIKNPGEFLGKSVNETGLKRMYHIAFTDHGVFNWSKSENDLFKPKTGSKLQILSVTNPAPYSVMIAKKDLDDKLINLIKKVFSDLKVKENIYGKFTGYNKFIPIDLSTFETLLNNYNYSETNVGNYQSPSKLLKYEND